MESYIFFTRFLNTRKRFCTRISAYLNHYDMTRFKCVFCLILSNDLLIYQWNPICFCLSIFKYEKNVFFTKISGYLNHLNQFIVLFSSNTFLSTDGILCVFSLILKYQEKCLFRLNNPSWKLLTLMNARLHCSCFLIMFILLSYFLQIPSYLQMEFHVFFRSNFIWMETCFCLLYPIH
jgi:hypothetical protein